MAALVEKKDRKVIPRWRPFRTTVALGELNASRPPSPEARPTADFLRDKIADWLNHKTLWHATDLVGAALVLGRETEARGAAEFILSSIPPASAPARAFATNILTPSGQHAEAALPAPERGQETFHKMVHELRHLSAEQPRNSIIWVDLALAYTVIGMSEQADRAIRVALKLDPTNRFVLRSAARFHVHQGGLQVAHRLLTKADSTRNDPWLLAAEIAVASAANRAPMFVRSAREILSDDSVPPKQQSELASAMATLELQNAKHATARKLFHKSLIAPTENSVAQAEWASERMKGLALNLDRLKVPRLFEARAWASVTNGDWEGALQYSKNWLTDQPFSSRPATLASYLVSTIFEDHSQAEDILRPSLAASPSEPTLLNNLAFAYACEGKTDEAERALREINATSLAGPPRLAVLATRGLILFRKGLPDTGRDFYLQAIHEAADLGLNRYKALAAIYLAREETLAHTKQAPEAIQRAIVLSRTAEGKDVPLLLDRLTALHATGRIPAARDP